MIKKIWDFVKENIVTIVTVVTAIISVGYAIIRLLIYVYWRGYFSKLNISVSIMNLKFQKSIFEIIFVSIILIIVGYFMFWVMDIINDFKENSLKQNRIIIFFKKLILSFGILSVVNIPLIILLGAAAKIDFTLKNMILLIIMLYVIEIFFILIHIFSKSSSDKKKDKTIEWKIGSVIVELFLFILMFLALTFYIGDTTIDHKTSVQLVENGEYMISYCDGEQYVLHRVKYEKGNLTIYRNEQKIVKIDDYEYCVKGIESILIED